MHQIMKEVIPTAILTGGDGLHEILIELDEDKFEFFKASQTDCPLQFNLILEITLNNFHLSNVSTGLTVIPFMES